MAYTGRLQDEIKNGSPTLGFGISSDAIGVWFDRGIDYAANFPAFVLLLVAWTEIGAEDHIALIATLIILTVAGSIAFIIFGEPAGKKMRSWKGVTAVSWSIVVGNLVAVVVAIVMEYTSR